MRTKLQNEKATAFFQNKTLPSKYNSETRQNSSNKKEDSVAFNQKDLFSDDISSHSTISTCLTRFDHSAYVMIPGKLYKYEEMVSLDSSDLGEKSCADLFVPYNIALIYLKNTILDIIFAKSKTMDKKQYQKAFKKLKVWVFQTSKQKWIQLAVESDWTHAKLLAQEGSETLKLMYSLHLQPGHHGSKSASASSTLGLGSKSSENQIDDNDDDDATSMMTSNSELNEARNRNGLLLRSVDIHTPSPPVVDVATTGSMMLLKSDGSENQSKSYFDSIPKEQFMANILESRLMKSRF